MNGKREIDSIQEFLLRNGVGRLQDDPQRVGLGHNCLQRLQQGRNRKRTVYAYAPPDVVERQGRQKRLMKPDLLLRQREREGSVEFVHKCYTSTRLPYRPTESDECRYLRRLTHER